MRSVNDIYIKKGSTCEKAVLIRAIAMKKIRMFPIEECFIQCFFMLQIMILKIEDFIKKVHEHFFNN